MRFPSVGLDFDPAEGHAEQLRIEYYAALDSTQDEVARRLKSGEDVHGLVVRAGKQGGGRGRRGRGWASLPGGSYQTLGVRDPAPPLLRQSWVAPCLAVGLASAFAASGIKLGVKWPNDLYRYGGKVGGVLCEYLHEHLLVGVGVNVHNSVPEGASRIDEMALESVNAIVLRGLGEGLRLAARNEGLPERFAAYDVLGGQPVEVGEAGELLKGVARGVTREGFLVLERPDGSRLEVRRGRLSRFSVEQ
jgi:BirA family transcriptional regulator, biotin operon repressor / biotin---[acetyl-CoA-carboxylase] ligase